MDFLKWYKNTVNSGKEEPPNYTWENIQNDLDIDRVYERLEGSLQKDRRKMWIWRASSAAGILLLLSAGTILFNRFHQTTTEKPLANNSATPDPAHLLSDSIKIPLPLVDTDSVQGISKITNIERNNTLIELKTDPEQEILITKLSQEPTIKSRTKSHNSFQFKSKLAEIPLANNIATTRINDNKLSSMSFILSDAKIVIPHEAPLAHIEMSEPEKESFIPEHNNPKQIFSKITVFAVGELANTWLISPKTKEAFDPQDFTANQTTIKQNYGIGISGKITERWDVVGQFSFARQNGQHYKEYYQGKYVSNNIDLEYTDIVLKARHRPFKRNLNHAFSAGLYTAFLNNAHQLINDAKSDISSDYTKNDFGLIAGYQYFAPVTDKITLAAGAFYRQGLKNIFAGNSLVSENLNHSSNTSFNFTLSIGYTFSL